MGQKRQGGSTIGYVIIGVILIASLVGGVYALRQATAQKPVEVATQPSENKKEMQKETQPQTSEQKPPAESENEKNGTETPPANEPTTPSEPAKEDETPQTENVQPAPSNAQPELPRTGMSGVGGWMALSLLVGAGVAYARSRRFTLT